MLFKQFHQMVCHAVVDRALALNAAFFKAVKGGGVILVIHQYQVGVVGRVYFFGLAFVELLQLFHK